jgi:glyoxylase-like metal-dependent hydrolase (beta-lactamase superfamily II)
MQLLPNVYLVNGPPYGQTNNGYLVRVGETAVLIDSGANHEEDCFDTVCETCRIWGIDVDRISHFLVTHAHFDHASHAARFREKGTKIVASQIAAEAMATADDRCLGWFAGRIIEPCETDRVVEDGDDLVIEGLTFRCIAAPGHTECCMIYELVLDGRRLWFGGDVVSCGPDGRSAGLGWNGAPDYDRATYVETLRRLCHMECDCLFPGHGPPSLGNGKRMVERAYGVAMMQLR